MVIDTQRRIEAMARAMRDVIIPAIDPKMVNAREQAGYIVQHLGLMSGQTNWDTVAKLAEIRDFLKLTESLLAVVNSQAPADLRREAEAALAEASEYANLRLPDLRTLKTISGRLRQTSDELLKVSRTLAGGAREKSSAAVIETAKRQEKRKSALMQGSGYDTGDGSAQDIENALHD